MRAIGRQARSRGELFIDYNCSPRVAIQYGSHQ